MEGVFLSLQSTVRCGVGKFVVQNKYVRALHEGQRLPVKAVRDAKPCNRRPCGIGRIKEDIPGKGKGHGPVVRLKHLVGRWRLRFGFFDASRALCFLLLFRGLFCLCSPHSLRLLTCGKSCLFRGDRPDQGGRLGRLRLFSSDGGKDLIPVLRDGKTRKCCHTGKKENQKHTKRTKRMAGIFLPVLFVRFRSEILFRFDSRIGFFFDVIIFIAVFAHGPILPQARFPRKKRNVKTKTDEKRQKERPQPFRSCSLPDKALIRASRAGHRRCSVCFPPRGALSGSAPCCGRSPSRTLTGTSDSR